LLAMRQDVKTHPSAPEKAVLNDAVQQGSDVTEDAAAVLAAVDSKQLTANQEIAASKVGSSTATAGEAYEVIQGLCKHAKISVGKAVGLSAQDSTIYPFVKVSYRSKQSLGLTFKTEHVKAPPNPVVWDYTQKVLLCNKTEPVHFEVYDEGYFSNTLLAKTELDAAQFWDAGFAGSLMLKDDARSQLQVNIEL